MNLIQNSPGANASQIFDLDQVFAISPSDDGNGNYYIYFTAPVGSQAFWFDNLTDRDTCLANILSLAGNVTAV